MSRSQTRTRPTTSGRTTGRTTGRRKNPRHRKAGPRRHGRTRGHDRRRARALLAVPAAVLALVLAAAGWVYLRLDGDIDTFGADGIAHHRPEQGPSEAMNVLVIGSDARVSGNAALGGGAKDDAGRSDTAILLHVYADHRHAVAVSIPRDTLVDIPPCRLPDGTWTGTRRNVMFNEAYSVGQTSEGNPACTQNTVEKLTGLRVDHTIVVDFKGFATLTDVVGGVPVCLPRDVYEKDLDPTRATRGEMLLHKGEQTVSGRRALDYVRVRHGMGDGSDIGRIRRQQAFAASLVRRVKSEGLTPSRLLPLAEAATKSMTVDPGLGSPDKLVAFAMSLKDVGLSDIRFVTVPWRYEGERVALVQPDADALWRAIGDDRAIDGGDVRSGSPSPSAGKARPDTGASRSPLPKDVVDGSRSADDDLCSGLSYG
ncbi:LytR family transcriptional regulator [Streptomyces spongiicola]|uniref:LytR family transcriptional regulator n=1 Tax=Streptomyces spongiicola TaxID=1690221 RepID=A0ABN5KHD3_9ACTN|nr:LCP family protein [Streptomyces spongiicola]AWK09702.1 LytR family transcriptional regulator [Streptomyces spongiicola]